MASAQSQALCLTGALTIACAQAQRELLLAAIDATGDEDKGDGKGCDGLLDLSGIEAIDSAGVQLLLAARRSLEERGGRLVLQAAPPLVQQVFQTYGLQSLLASPQAS